MYGIPSCQCFAPRSRPLQHEVELELLLRGLYLWKMMLYECFFDCPRLICSIYEGTWTFKHLQPPHPSPFDIDKLPQSTTNTYPDIQSALHQTKRRFTDFVFQRVTLSSKDGSNDSRTPSPAHPAAQRLLRSPRSVSSLHAPKNRPSQSTSSAGVPLVRATSPGAEIREAQRVAVAKREVEEKRKRALYQDPNLQRAPAAPSTGVSSAAGVGERSTAPAAPSPSRAQSVRRFQISRPSTPSLGSLRSSAGIQKRRADGAAPGVAVLVEQLRRAPHSRQASRVADLVAAQANEAGAVETSDLANVSPVKPRKRPVVNQAEKRWRAERQGAISAAKQHLSETLEKSAQAHQSTWDEESERLAREFEQVALEMEQGMDVDHGESRAQPITAPDYKSISAPKPLKVQPRLPKEPRPVTQSQPQSSAEAAMEDPAVQPMEENDDDYVYDVYIRRPIAESNMLTNPLAELESDQQMKQLEAANQGVGVIVITAEDEEYWEHFVEDDEEEWDSEDADSNGEFCLPSLLFDYYFGRLGHLNRQESTNEEKKKLADHALTTPQPRTTQPTTTQMKNSPSQTRMTIHLPYMANTGATPHPTTRNSTSITPMMMQAPGTDLGLHLDTNGALLETWVLMMRAIESICLEWMGVARLL